MDSRKRGTSPARFLLFLLSLLAAAALGVAAGRAGPQAGAGARPDVVGAAEPGEKPGPPMVEVPAGWFLMGSKEAEGEPDERPQRRVHLDAFRLDKYPVTNEWYGRFMKATGREAPAFWGGSPFNAPTQPVVGVTWGDADAFCKWLGRRLPSEAEWEKAARGTDRWAYPWGDHWDPSKAIYEGNSQKRPHPVDRDYNTHASPYGAVDMAGNVWQWAADWHGKDYYARAPERNPTGPESGARRVQRGSSWLNHPKSLRAANRGGSAPGFKSGQVGFRCAAALRSP